MSTSEVSLATVYYLLNVIKDDWLAFYYSAMSIIAEISCNFQSNEQVLMTQFPNWNYKYINTCYEETMNAWLPQLRYLYSAGLRSGGFVCVLKSALKWLLQLLKAITNRVLSCPNVCTSTVCLVKRCVHLIIIMVETFIFTATSRRLVTIQGKLRGGYLALKHWVCEIVFERARKATISTQ